MAAAILAQINGLFAANSTLMNISSTLHRSVDWHGVATSRMFRYVVVPIVAVPVVAHVMSPTRNPLVKWLQVQFMEHIMVIFNEKNREDLEGLLSMMGSVTTTTAPDQSLTVVEIGSGSGNLFQFFPVGIKYKYYPVEPAHACRESLEKNIKLYPDIEMIEYLEQNGEKLDPFETGTVDVVILKHVLCTVDDARQVLSEVKRILKPGGKILFFEHIAAEKGRSLLRVQQFLRCLWFYMFQCRLMQDTTRLIEEAGFTDVQYSKFDSTTQFVLKPVIPHVSGVAVKGGQ